ncbi:M24 family metallopeptidase [Chelativorans xinjiangense]|uniref:M24 family metallopeptidase n=1 Tax=Chelativorans xinjiangense TaxID=2681485 RepID=UPI00135C6BCE|nr:Xaa-Pro peptidase family protein [Chelativorans xinjiangense]
MIDGERRSARFARLIDSMDRAGLDGVAMVPGANLYYLTGAHFHLMERPTLLFVSRDGAQHAIIPILERARWQALAPDVETEYWQDSDGYEKAFVWMADRIRGARLGVEGQRMRVFESEALRRNLANVMVVDAQAEISQMRLCKDDDEVAVMQRAVEISEAALAAVIEWVRPGMSEVAVKNKLLAAMLENGADGAAFDPIVLSGPASADPHGTPSVERMLAAGDSLLIDFGAAWGGYNADITRTFFVSRVSERHREIYETVREANAVGRAAVRPGMSLHALDDAVTGRLAESEFAELIVHKTGHGLGLDVHEPPQVMIGNHQEMVPGMMITIEPGLYKPGEVGVRIEDDVLVTEDGCRSLSGFERQLTVIGG